MKRILILANSASGLYDFRNELLLRLMEEGYEVHISLPDGDKTSQLVQEGCIVHHIPLERRGMNPLRDMRLLCAYRRLMKELQPQMVLTYTIKPNIYGGLSARMRHTPYLVNITGLGSVFERGGLLQRLVVFLYRVALYDAQCIFFQNETNQQIFEQYHIHGKRTRLVSGSGVNLDRHCREVYPKESEAMRFLYVGRIMKEKGMDELLYAARRIKQDYPKVIFELVGYYEDDYKEKIEQFERDGIVQLTEYQKDIHPYYTRAWAVLMPSYHEGMSNVILEASATGRPVLASNIPGCREGYTEGVTGYGYPPRDGEALTEVIRRFLALPYEKKMQMGQAARTKMECEFDRKQVVNAYIEEIRRIKK